MGRGMQPGTTLDTRWEDGQARTEQGGADPTPAGFQAGHPNPGGSLFLLPFHLLSPLRLPSCLSSLAAPTSCLLWSGCPEIPDQSQSVDPGLDRGHLGNWPRVENWAGGTRVPELPRVYSTLRPHTLQGLTGCSDHPLSAFSEPTLPWGSGLSQSAPWLLPAYV